MAPSVNIPATGSNSVTCGVNTVVYLNNGTSNYSDNDNGYTVLNATAGSAAVISLSGTYNNESCCDYLALYSGSGTGGTLIATYAGTGTFTYTGTAGQTLTLYFVSDVSNNYAGNAVNVSYSGSCTPVPPTCATYTAPANAATGQTAPVLTWGAVTGATSYDVYIGTTLPGTPTANVVTTTYNPTGLIAGATYQWKIVPKNSGGSATGCATYSFTMGTAPSCATYTSPANASSQFTAPTLTWGAVTGAASYDVYFGTLNPPTTVVSASQTGTTYVPTVAANTTY